MATLHWLPDNGNTCHYAPEWPSDWLVITDFADSAALPAALECHIEVEARP